MNNNATVSPTTSNEYPGMIVPSVEYPCGCKVTGTDNYGMDYCEPHWEQLQPREIVTAEEEASVQEILAE